MAGRIKIPDGRLDGSRPQVNATVKLFPRDGQSPYLTSARAGTRDDGAFIFTGLPQGSYTAFAVVRDSMLNLEDPDVRKQWEKFGNAVDLEPGKAAVLELPLVPDDQP